VVHADPIRILSVEDHPVFREGLATIIGSQKDMLLVAQAANAVEAMAEFRLHRPDITLMTFGFLAPTVPTP
jgi:DNA-binding NarL/FixJ family response regulator